jgi:ubiquinone/menaquinone biosynthesis C-methylase UbiE
MCDEQSSNRERSSKSVPEENARLMALYQKQARGYDQSGIHGLDAFRREAVRRLELKRGDLVVDLGCGTGLNFALLQEAIGKTGRIIGVDLTDAMLEQARRRVVAHGWENVELVQADATSYEFPIRVDGILSTFALTFVPQAQLVIQNGCRALAPGRRWVVLDMAWPRAWPVWFHPLLFFLRLSRYGITGEVIRRRPWQTVWSTMQQSLVEVERQPLWMGFFYLAWGTQPQPT